MAHAYALLEIARQNAERARAAPSTGDRLERIRAHIELTEGQIRRFREYLRKCQALAQANEAKLEGHRRVISGYVIKHRS